MEETDHAGDGPSFEHLYYLLEAAIAGLGVAIAPAQLAHIARHKPFLRKQFRQG